MIHNKKNGRWKILTIFLFYICIILSFHAKLHNNQKNNNSKKTILSWNIHIFLLKDNTYLLPSRKILRQLKKRKCFQTNAVKYIPLAIAKNCYGVMVMLLLLCGDIELNPGPETNNQFNYNEMQINDREPHIKSTTRGRPVKHDNLYMLAIYNDYKDEIIVNNTLVSRYSNIWKNIESDERCIVNKISSRALYSYIANNTKNIKASLGLTCTLKEKKNCCKNFISHDTEIKGKNLNFQCQSNISNNHDSSESSDYNINSDEESDEASSYMHLERSNADISFQIKLCPEDAHCFQPIKKTYKRRTRKSGTQTKWVLKQGSWAPLLFRYINENVENTDFEDCGFSFKSHYVNNQNLIKIKGSCPTCNAYTQVTSFKIEEILYFDIHIKSVLKNVTHNNSKKKKITGVVRECFANKLEKLKAANVQNAVAPKLIIHQGEINPKKAPDFPSKNSLRILKCRSRAKNFFHRHPLIALAALKESGEMSTKIKNISLSPGYVDYTQNNQILVAQEISNKEKLVISADSTGGLCHSLPLVSDNSLKSKSPIFLYIMVAKMLQGASVLVSQAFFDTHSAKAIGRWIEDQSLNGMPTPSEVHCDMSPALLNAFIQQYAKLNNVAEYIRKCYCYIDKRVGIPRCYIRFDVSHFIHRLASWKIFKHRKKQKQFYIQCICLALRCQKFDDIKKIFSNIALVACTEYNTEICLASLRCLNEGLKEMNIDDFTMQFNLEHDINGDYIYNDYNNIDLNEDTELVNIEDWFQAPATNRMQENAETENIYFLPSLTNELKRISKTVPMWSACMVNMFESKYLVATSGDCENQIKQIKSNDLCNLSLPVRLDEVVISHIPQIIGKTLISATRVAELIPENKKSTPQITETDKSLLLRTNSNNTLKNKLEYQNITHNLPLQSNCIACTNGDNPTGAHKCIICSKSIHILDGCSFKLILNGNINNENEGFGEKRYCFVCYSKNHANENELDNIGITESEKNNQYLDVEFSEAIQENWMNKNPLAKSRNKALLLSSTKTKKIQKIRKKDPLLIRAAKRLAARRPILQNFVSSFIREEYEKSNTNNVTDVENSDMETTLNNEDFICLNVTQENSNMEISQNDKYSNTLNVFDASENEITNVTAEHKSPPINADISQSPTSLEIQTVNTVVECKKSKNIFSYMSPLVENDLKNSIALTSKKTIGILKYAECKKITVDKVSYAISNTCSFDALTIALSVVSFDSQIVRSHIVNIKSKFGNIINLINKSGITPQVYKQRVKILRDFVPQALLIKGLVQLKCDMTINTLLQKLFNCKDFGVLSKSVCSSPVCPKQTRESIFSHFALRIKVEDLLLQTVLQEKIDEVVCNRTTICNENFNSIVGIDHTFYSMDDSVPLNAMCNGIRSLSSICNNIIYIFEVSFKDIGKQSESFSDITRDSDVYVPLANIPKIIIIRGKKYNLRSVIDFEPPINDTYVGHFIANVRRNSGKWQNFNDKLNTVEPSKKNVNPCLLLYSQQDI